MSSALDPIRHNRQTEIGALVGQEAAERLHALVTGGAGFIGSHLCEALLQRGCRVVALDNFDDFYDPAEKRANVASLAANHRFSLIEGDIRDPEICHRALSTGVSVVVHLAARAGVRPSLEQPLLYEDVNVRGTLVLLEAIRTRGACKFIFGSSSSIYGNSQCVPFHEDDRMDGPVSPYAATKRAGELFCYTYHHLYGIPVTCLRFFTAYGPRQRPDLAVRKFAELIESGRPVPIYGDGSMTRDFTYIDDIVDGVVRASDRCSGYRIYNLGSSRPVSVSQLVSCLEGAMSKEARTVYRDRQPGDVERTHADITLARKELGFQPDTTLATGLARFVQWFRGDRRGMRGGKASAAVPC